MEVQAHFKLNTGQYLDSVLQHPLPGEVVLCRLHLNNTQHYTSPPCTLLLFQY